MRFSLVLISLFVTACTSPVGWTNEDYSELLRLQKIIPENTDLGKNAIMADLIHHNPVELAHTAANENNYSLIGLAMGYQASEEDAKILGLQCNQDVPIQPIVFGCMPPTEQVLYKQMVRYNLAMYKNDKFPYKEMCEIDNNMMIELSGPAVF